MKKTMILLLAVYAMALPAPADDMPVVSDVTFTQSTAGSRLVTINYTLTNAPGIVTIDVLTNGTSAACSIGSTNINHVWGDVNKLIQPSADTRKTVYWEAGKSWPGHKITTESVVIAVHAWHTNYPPQYMAVNLDPPDGEDPVSYYADDGAVPGGVTSDTYKDSTILLRRVDAAGEPWVMGTKESGLLENGWEPARETNQTVTLKHDYYIGVYEVTQGQWTRIYGSNPAYFSVYYDEYPGRPVEKVSYNIIRGISTASYYPADPADGSFLDLAREKTGIAFDLPSEAQWEYACRAGTGQGYWNTGFPIVSSGNDTNLNKIARTTYNGGGSYNRPADVSPTGGTAVVGMYMPNAWGLYDMHGNVWEWCLDWYEAQHVYPNQDGAVNTAIPLVQKRVRRGGAYYGSASVSRSATRYEEPPISTSMLIGFRLAVPIGKDEGE